MDSLFINFYFFIFGALMGSFANVLIYRVPLGKSIVTPRSFCPHCQKTIRWYENIPIFSYILVKGKCSQCQATIPFSYFLVEVLSAGVAVFLVPHQWSVSSLLIFLFYFNVYLILISLLIIDWRHQILPDALNLFLGLLLGLYALYDLPWKFSLLGFFLGGFLPLAVTWAFYVIRGKIGLGGGDIKLYAVLGLYLGPAGIIQNIFSSCFLGSLAGVTLLCLKKIEANRPIPFGPFIIIAAFFQIFFPKQSSWVFSLFH